MALFGGRDVRSVEDDALVAEIDRLERLPVPELAAVVMAKAFAPGAGWEDPEEEVTVGGPSAGAGATVTAIAAELAPGGTTRGADERAKVRLERLAAEGVQALEHAALVRPQMHAGVSELDYTPTRLGRKVLAAGAVAEVVGGA